MKLTPEQKARLKALLAIATRNEAEETEFKKLDAMAKTEGYDPAKEKEEEGLSEEAVKALIDKGVTEGVTKGLKALGIDDALLTSVKTSLESTKGLTADTVESIVKKHLGGDGIDKTALLAEIKKSITEGAPKGVTEAELTKALSTFADTIREKSSHQFPAGGHGVDHYPIEHRAGNLTVAQKQLLNICLGAVAQEGLDKSNFGQGIKRPTGMNDGITPVQLQAAVRAGEMGLKSLRNSLVYGRKTLLTSTGSGTGDELVPSDLSSDLGMRLYLESPIAAEFMSSEIDMPTNPFTLPLITTRATFYRGSENPGSDPTDGTPGTGNTVLTAAKLIGMCTYTYEADEDSIISILPMLQEQLGSGAADALEDAIINGDTAGTHQDTDTEAAGATVAATLFNGLRKLALAISGLKADLSTGNISAANILGLKKLLLKYGVRPRDLLIICGVKGHSSFLGLDETLTADKVGNDRAAILTGSAPQLFGSKIIVSARCREDTDATGVNGASGNTKGTVLLVHKPSFIMGVRRGFTVEVDVDKKQQLNYVIASFRRAFMPRETPSATISSVAIGYNFTP